MRVFLMLARTGQLSEAARRIGTSHVTVARRMERLEAALSQRLFARNAKGYALTPAGRRLVETAEKMEAAAEGLTPGADDAGGLTGTFRLAMPEAFGSYFADHLLAGFVRRFPRVALEMVTMTQVMSLSRREADLSVTVDPLDKGPYQSVKLLDYDLGLYATQTYLQDAAPLTCREDLPDHRLIGYVEGMIFSPGLDYLDEVHPGLRPALKGTSIFNQLSATRAGLGLCVLPCYIARRFADLVPVLPDLVRLRRGYWLTGHREATQLRRERSITRHLQDELSRHAPAFLR